MDKSQNTFTVNISHGQKVLSLPFSSLPSYNEITSRIKTSFPNVKSQAIFYIDDEGDEVSIRSEMELNEAYRLAEQQGNHSVRLYLEKVERLPEPDVSPKTPLQPVQYAPFLPPESLSTSYQRPSNDITRSQVLEFRSAEESEILVKIQSKLTEMTSVVSHLAKAKQEHTEKMKQSSEYENEINLLRLEKNRLEQALAERQYQIKNLDTELETQKNKNNDLVEQITELKEKEENTNRSRQEELAMFQDVVKQKTVSIATLENRLTILKEALSKMGKELMKEKEMKSELESKVSLLTNEVDVKTGQYLEMSRRILNVEAQKNSLNKKATDLERMLEQEHQERESLQQSLVQLQFQGSISAGKNPFEFRTDLNSESYVLKPEDLTKEKMPEIQRWGSELGVLNGIGYNDNNKNLEYLAKHKDVTAVVKAIEDESKKIPKQKEVPSDISESDIQLLEAMGFSDIDYNVKLLRTNGNDISKVVENLIAQMK
jgi:myosin heavy subunit